MKTTLPASQARADSRLWLKVHPGYSESFRILDKHRGDMGVTFILEGHRDVTLPLDEPCQVTPGTTVSNPEDYIFLPVYVLQEIEWRLDDPLRE